MKCEGVRKFISPYLDSELDAKTNMEINEHLDSCSSCRTLFEKEQRLEKTLKSHLVSDQETKSAWDKALSETVKKPKPYVRPLQIASVVIVLSLVMSGGWFRFAVAEQDLARTAVKSHDSYVSDDMPLEIRSSDPEQIETFFNDKLSFEVKVPKECSVKGAKLVGARICHLKEVPVAYLVYHINNEPVSLFLMPTEGSSEFRQLAKDQDDGEDLMQKHKVGDKAVVTCKVPQGVLCALGSTSMENLEELAFNYEEM